MDINSLLNSAPEGNHNRTPSRESSPHHLRSMQPVRGHTEQVQRYSTDPEVTIVRSSHSPSLGGRQEWNPPSHRLPPIVPSIASVNGQRQLPSFSGYRRISFYSSASSAQTSPALSTASTASAHTPPSPKSPKAPSPARSVRQSSQPTSGEQFEGSEPPSRRGSGTRRGPVSARERREFRPTYSPEEELFIWYHRDDLSLDWREVRDAYNLQFPDRNRSGCQGLQCKYYRCTSANGVPPVRERNRQGTNATSKHGWGLLDIRPHERFAWMKPHHLNRNRTRR